MVLGYRTIVNNDTTLPYLFLKLLLLARGAAADDGNIQGAPLSLRTIYGLHFI